MSEELSFNGAEFAKPVENKGKYKQKRLLFILFYIAFAGAYLYVALVATKAAAIIAILPLFIYILYLATWRYCNFEWLIRVNVGKISIYHVYNKREKEKHSFMAKTILSALPDTQENFDKLKVGATVIDFRTAPGEWLQRHCQHGLCDVAYRRAHPPEAEFAAHFLAHLKLVGEAHPHRKAVG